MDLTGLVALVTGGGSGIGRSTAQRLAAEGMQVCVVDLDDAAAVSVAEGVGGMATVADVADRAALEGAFQRCLETFGRIDVAHLNAGVSLDPGDIASLDAENYRRSVAVNIDHVVFGTGAAVRAMRLNSDSRGPRTIVATASLAGIDPFFPNAVYTLTKHAVVGFIRAIAPGLAMEGIGAHAICPGLTDTAMVPPHRKAALVQAGFPFVEPERIAEAVLTAITSPLEATGTCWIGHPGQPPLPWEFCEVPGPHQRVNIPNRR
jgi:NAD(P)-dependent dehydrogenase (short-subunit alcohol dehydrogenase family)